MTNTAASVDHETIVTRFHSEWRHEEDPALDRYWFWCRGVRVDPNELIADDGEGNLYSVPFTTDGEDQITFGEPARVRETYVPVAAGAGATAATAARRRRQTVLADGLAKPTFPQRTASSTPGATPSATADPAAAPPTSEEMPVNATEIREALGLDPEATDEQVLQTAAANTAVATTADPAATTEPATSPVVATPAPGTIEPVTTAAGAVTVDAQQHAATVAEAEAGRAAIAELAELKDTTARDAYFAEKVNDGTLHADSLPGWKLHWTTAGATQARAAIDAMKPGVVPVLQRRGQTAAAADSTDAAEARRQRARSALGTKPINDPKGA